MDAKQAQELVVKTWERVHFDGNRVLAERPNGGHWILSGNPNAHLFEHHHHLDAPESWLAAATFTLERLEQIRQVEREIESLDDVETTSEEWKDWCDNRAPSADQDYVREAIRGHARDLRILAREQAALTALKQGMRA